MPASSHCRPFLGSKKHFCTFFSSLLLLLNVEELAGRELAFLQCVWRHGDRAPGSLPYPGDVYNETFWPRGWSQLTTLGMGQMRELGQFLRERYTREMAFLSASYDQKEVFIQSSDSTRALESAQALLHGLFPAMRAEEQFSPDSDWQPIAVHSTGPNNELLKPTSFDCPVYEKLKNEVKSQLEREMVEKYPELFQFLDAQVFNATRPISLHKAAKLHNIKREVIHGLEQPPWVSQLWPQYGNLSTLALVTELRRQERIGEFKRAELAYLKGGYLLGDWIQRAKHFLKGKSPREATKAVFYSAHDGTLQSLLYAMGLGDDQLVPYAALICMEIYKQPNGKEYDEERDEEAHQIEFIYRHSGQVRRLELANCPLGSCPAKMALKMLKKNAIFNRQKLFEECGNAENFCEMAQTGVDTD